MLETGLRDKLALYQVTLAITHETCFFWLRHLKKKSPHSARTVLPYSPLFASHQAFLSSPPHFILEGCCGSPFLSACSISPQFLSLLKAVIMKGHASEFYLLDTFGSLTFSGQGWTAFLFFGLWVHIHVSVCTPVCGGQRTTLGISLSCCPPVFETGSLTVLVSTDKVRLAGE